MSCSVGIYQMEDLGSLSISGVEMCTPAWWVLNLRDLWVGPDVRGEDLTVPLLDGVVPYRRRPTVTTHTLNLLIVGSVDHTGAPYDSEAEGVETNIQYLKDFVVECVGGNGTRPSVLVMPSGAEREADITVLDLHPGDGIVGGMVATLDISIPAGSYVGTGS